MSGHHLGEGCGGRGRGLGFPGEKGQSPQALPLHVTGGVTSNNMTLTTPNPS